jgi:hypothetical protein
MREWRDGRDEVGIISVHVAPFAYLRFTRHGLWRQRIFQYPARVEGGADVPRSASTKAPPENPADPQLTP